VCLWAPERCRSDRVRVRVVLIFVGNVGFVLFCNRTRQVFRMFLSARVVIERQGEG
jgi:hypothetical protein